MIFQSHLPQPVLIFRFQTLLWDSGKKLSYPTQRFQVLWDARHSLYNVSALKPELPFGHKSLEAQNVLCHWPTDFPLEVSCPYFSQRIAGFYQQINNSEFGKSKLVRKFRALYAGYSRTLNYVCQFPCKFPMYLIYFIILFWDLWEDVKAFFVPVCMCSFSS